MDADLKVFVVKYRNEEDTAGRWYFVDYPNEADYKVYFVEHPADADIKIFYTKFRNEAGWRNKRKSIFITK